MTFKDALTSDIKTFINPDEFGEKHKVNGKEMTVLIDDNEVVERSKKQSEHGRIDGIYGIYERQMMLYVERSVFGKAPAVGASLTIDRATYTVSDVSHEGGIYAILLGGFRS